MNECKIRVVWVKKNAWRYPRQLPSVLGFNAVADKKAVPPLPPPTLAVTGILNSRAFCAAKLPRHQIWRSCNARWPALPPAS